MKQVICAQCRGKTPRNDAFSVFERELCEPCADAEVAKYQGKQLPDGAVTRLVDPTICAQCAADNGDNDLPTIAQVPFCESCEQLFRNRPYPVWLKLSFTALVLLAAFSFVWNWRFLAGYRETQQMERALRASNWEAAAALSEAAAQHVPEVPELADMANFNRGVALLANEQSAKAVVAFKKARRGQNHLGPTLDRMLLQAEAGAAFEAGDYDGFLAKMQAYAATEPGSSQARAGVASAYACKYAAGGSDEDRDRALEELAQAAKLARPGDREFEEYRERIQHRLETREIISRKDFQKRFPAGFKSGSKP